MSALSALTLVHMSGAQRTSVNFRTKPEQGGCFGWWAVRPGHFWALWRALLEEFRLFGA